MNKKDLIQNSKRVVIKIGSALLVDKQNGSLNSTWLNSLALDIENFIKHNSISMEGNSLSIKFSMYFTNSLRFL